MIWKEGIALIVRNSRKECEVGKDSVSLPEKIIHHTSAFIHHKSVKYGKTRLIYDVKYKIYDLRFSHTVQILG